MHVFVHWASRFPLLLALYTAASICSAGAATITEATGLTTSVVVVGQHEQEYSGSSFPQFNPSLGTLNSIDLLLSVNVTNGLADTIFNIMYNTSNSMGTTQFQGSGSTTVPSCTSCGVIYAGFSFAITVPAASVSFDFNATNAADLAAFEGTGTANVAVTIQGSYLGTSVSFVAPETLSYNYTPTGTSVPEPSSLLILNFGVAVLTLMTALQHRRAQALGSWDQRSTTPAGPD